MDDIYTQNIIEHSKSPRHAGKLDGATVTQEANNPSCGDKLTLYLKIENGSVTDASFDGIGCAISTAASSMLLDSIIGKTLDDLKIMTPGDMYTMLGIEISPGRTQCALLAYDALTDALKQTNE
jgi:nitrogen fixation NifU-like protein